MAKFFFARFVAGTFLGGLLTACSAIPGFADVHLPAIESDNMMLQAGNDTHLFGSANSGETIKITYGGRETAATADSTGHWLASLSNLKAGETFDIVITGNNKVTIKNVLVGQVWLCSGQSNMEFALGQVKDAEKEVASAKCDQIRLFNVKRNVAVERTEDVEGSWKVCEPVTAAPFSAVGYFFGRALNEDLKTPIGLIESSWGGTTAQTWTSKEGLEADSFTKNRYWTPAQTRLATLAKEAREYEKAYAEWNSSPFKGKSQPPAKPADLNSPQSPALLFNGMIAPLLRYTIGGVIWYQGESNAFKLDEALAYRRLFPALILDWRKQFNQPLPFIFVQLANFGGPKDKPDNTKTWAELRESQLLTLGLPNTGMAVTIDIGSADDIHPKNKQDVGKRLERAALAEVYGRKETFSGPIFNHLDIKGDKAICSFKYADKGLKTRDGGPVIGFEICGADNKFVPAEAEIKKHTLIVSSDKVKKPTAVRYAWAGDPANNLYNEEGLPASPFRSEVPAEPPFVGANQPQ